MIALVLAACTFTPGTSGWVTLRSTTLTPALEPGAARQLDDGAMLSDQGWAYTFTRAELSADTLHIDELQGTSGVSFDPANPPAGYTSCHGGHCHADDGSLPTYAEIEAALAGDSAEFVALATWSFSAPLDLLAAQAQRLPEPEPGPDLPMATLRQLTFTTPHLRLEGSATPYPEGGEQVQVVVDLPLGADLSGPFDWTIDRSTAPAVALEVWLTLDGTLLDGLDPAAEAVDGTWTLSDPRSAAALVLLDTLFTQAPTATLTETP